jgi:hypothetical protein
MALMTSKASMSIKASADENYKVFVTELQSMITGLSTFIEKCQTELAKAEVFDPSSDDVPMQKSETALQGLASTAVHHASGATMAALRFKAILGK